jgi:uncharacterized protein
MTDKIRVINKTQNVLLADCAKLADTPSSRMIGLLNRSGLWEGEGLIIKPCQSIHMLFMRFPIDVVFVDAKGIVVGLCKSIPPFGFSPIFWNAEAAIELPSGIVETTQTHLGDLIEIA